MSGPIREPGLRRHCIVQYQRTIHIQSYTVSGPIREPGSLRGALPNVDGVHRAAVAVVLVAKLERLRSRLGIE